MSKNPASFHNLARERSDMWLALVTYLVANREAAQFEGWRIEPVLGGMNNRLYRVVGEMGHFAVKMTMRDERRRAYREYNALTAIEHAGLAIAPRAVWFDEHTFEQPVVVQTWLEGEVSAESPTAIAPILSYFTQLHTITPASIQTPIDYPSVISVNSAENIREIALWQASQTPADQRLPITTAVLDALQKLSLPTWPTPPVTLCRADNNLLNFVRQPTRWLGVDWEYAGWCDPAFDVAEMLACPKMRFTLPAFHAELIDGYANDMRDQSAPLRIRTYRNLMYAWWTQRLQRGLYEIPRGEDQRLVNRSPNWEADGKAKLSWYGEKFLAEI